MVGQHWPVTWTYNHNMERLNKALYGLWQAPRAWNNKLNQILMELVFSKCTKEPSVYQKTIKGELLVVAVYVDDLFVTGTTKKLINEFKKDMASKFDMSDLGRLTYYLGIEVVQDDRGITLNLLRRYLRMQEWLSVTHLKHPWSSVLTYQKRRKSRRSMRETSEGTSVA